MDKKISVISDLDGKKIVDFLLWTGRKALIYKEFGPVYSILGENIAG